jgi:hypothetical protein
MMSYLLFRFAALALGERLGPVVNLLLEHFLLGVDLLLLVVLGLEGRLLRCELLSDRFGLRRAHLLLGNVELPLEVRLVLALHLGKLRGKRAVLLDLGLQLALAVLDLGLELRDAHEVSRRGHRAGSAAWRACGGRLGRALRRARRCRRRRKRLLGLELLHLRPEIVGLLLGLRKVGFQLLALSLALLAHGPGARVRLLFGSLQLRLRGLLLLHKLLAQRKIAFL